MRAMEAAAAAEAEAARKAPGKDGPAARGRQLGGSGAGDRPAAKRAAGGAEGPAKKPDCLVVHGGLYRARRLRLLEEPFLITFFSSRLIPYNHLTALLPHIRPNHAATTSTCTHHKSGNAVSGALKETSRSFTALKMTWGGRGGEIRPRQAHF